MLPHWVELEHRSLKAQSHSDTPPPARPGPLQHLLIVSLPVGQEFKHMSLWRANLFKPLQSPSSVLNVNVNSTNVSGPSFLSSASCYYNREEDHSGLHMVLGAERVPLLPFPQHFCNYSFVNISFPVN